MCENTEMELLLFTALTLSPSKVKDIAEAMKINASTLYKWKTMSERHLTQPKQDALLWYFLKNEPDILILALIVTTITTILLF